MKVRVIIEVDGKIFEVVGTAVEVQDKINKDKKTIKKIKKILKHLDVATIANITNASEGELSLSVVRRVMKKFDGYLWNGLEYQHPNGGQKTTQYKLIEKETK